MKTININGKDFTVEELNQLIEQSKTENIKVDKEKEKEKLFLELFLGLEIRLDIEKFPDSVNYYRNGVRVLEMERYRLWVDYRTIWKKFEDKFGMKDNEIQYFIKQRVKKHFKWNSDTTSWDGFTAIVWYTNLF